MTSPARARLPRCNGCAHYFITHDASRPYGCRIFDFKSRRQPVLEVMEASWQECLYFSRRPAEPRDVGESGRGFYG